MPRVPSIFDPDFGSHTARVGAPPPLGRGTGFLYVVARTNIVGGVDLGKSVLLIKEKRTNEWGAPGGMTDATDHSPLHAAMREFSEEVGADWRRLANGTQMIEFVRIRPAFGVPPTANESWGLLTGMSAQDIEALLFEDDRSKWPLSKRMNYRGAKDSAGYAIVPIADVLNADPRTGAFKIGPNDQKLRDARRTLEALINIP